MFVFGIVIPVVRLGRHKQVVNGCALALKARAYRVGDGYARGGTPQKNEKKFHGDVAY